MTKSRKIRARSDLR